MTDACAKVRSLIPLVSDRKLRLFCCACCRRIWNHLSPNCQRGIEVAESFSDGNASLNELEAVHQVIQGEVSSAGAVACLWTVTNRVPFFARLEDWWDRLDYITTSVLYDAWKDANSRAPVYSDEQEYQMVLLHDIFDDPYQGMVPKPAWINQLPQSLIDRAVAIYQWREYADLPHFANALEEGGYVDPSLLIHFRSHQEHVRGCWALDLLLAKT